MASGATHDRYGLIGTPVVGIAVYSLTHNPTIAISLTVGFFVGIWWLSPDIDTPSKPWRRWGMLRWFWVPYQKLGKHRGLSHWLIAGTLSRLLYLGAPIVLLVMLSGNVAAIGWIVGYPAETIGFWVGLELSAMLHLGLDGLL